MRAGDRTPGPRQRFFSLLTMFALLRAAFEQLDATAVEHFPTDSEPCDAEWPHRQLPCRLR